MRIVHNLDAFGKNALAQRLLQKACLARNGGTGNRTGQMTDKTRGDARIIDNRHRLGFYLARGEATNGACASLASDLCG